MSSDFLTEMKNFFRGILQVSNRLDPNWVPDPTITNPYMPK